MELIGGKDAGEPSSESLACVELLEAVLKDAKAGKITTVGIIACGAADFGANVAGSDARSVYMGCGVLMNRIIQVTTGQQVVPSAILRPQNSGNIFPKAPRPVGPRR
jgi:hypothetical protein